MRYTVRQQTVVIQSLEAPVTDGRAAVELLASVRYETG